jgi:hypothetical protein
LELWVQYPTSVWDARNDLIARIDTFLIPATDTSKEAQSGVELIAAERARQVSDESWTPEHDDEHTDRELARAASCYAYPPGMSKEGRARNFWPWDEEWWKPDENDLIRNLTKAGALIAAEIDRLLRASSEEVQGE